MNTIYHTIITQIRHVYIPHLKAATATGFPFHSSSQSGCVAGLKYQSFAAVSTEQIHLPPVGIKMGYIGA